MAGSTQIKSPVALATFGAFFVPEPLGTCLVLLAALWWLWRKLYYNDDADLLLEVSDRNLSFYIFRAGQGTTCHTCGYAGQRGPRYRGVKSPPWASQHSIHGENRIVADAAQEFLA